MAKTSPILTFKINNMRILYLILFLISYSCNSIPKEYLINDNVCHYNDPIFKITKDEMIFDIKKHQKELEKNHITLTNDKNYRIELWESNNGGLRNKQINKQISIERLIRYDSLGRASYSYFTYLNGDSKIYKETHYNKQGKVEKVVDYEKGYKICWAEAIEIVKQIAKKDIEKYEIKDFYAVHNNLNEFPEVKPQWYVGFMNGNEKFNKHKYKKGNIRYVIDGVTGKLIRTYKITYD